PNYLFLGTGLSYQPTGVTLSVGRNGTSFASVAQTPNERAVAAAADALAAGNPVYESLLGSGTAGEARQAFRQLSGQIHADIASALVNDSRYLREALNGRLRQA
ncbi:autotransporter outer membrane beta-barrel domain-containing protein, partial [Serratia nevei]